MLDFYFEARWGQKDFESHVLSEDHLWSAMDPEHWVPCQGMSNFSRKISRMKVENNVPSTLFLALKTKQNIKQDT